MLFRFFDHVRSKPKPVRERYAFTVALGFTGMVALIWVAVLPARFADNDVQGASAPFAGLFSQIKSETSALKTETENIFNTLPSMSSTTPTTTNEAASDFNDPLVPKDMENALGLLFPSTTEATESNHVMIRISSSTPTTTATTSN